ncbi:Metacaspase-1 OS=Schizosaccharomyces pombe (strain 972 / ATCC 24843) GN=pca1 PE=2 SV=1 [Rhizoctonia solani AG-1 IB]|uniref:Metacaspase-1 n=1 Tax=Thanatephorus cucumeris (strain AG1-IB / isolate 7/3/14) TaxID=1108050 RepID=A0A0B7FAZ8_THACB|nr:Metacaspase-1 OS=Schizosaccharomyces pombe (strain 972 / ATCC 24843) GN=pca1 PE=2 SV=1 [Rhizoctonia solani AG-1 IB]
MSEYDEDAGSTHYDEPTHPQFQHMFPLDDDTGNEYDLPTPPDDMHRPDEERQHYGPIVYNEDEEEVQPLYFRLSQATGKRKALLIGCNYPGSSAPLNGCINDVFNIKRFLIDHFQYDEADIRVLTDDESSHGEVGEAQPTRETMLEYINWLVADAETDDSLFFFYSGHGGNQDDHDGDEWDGKDESICPTDYEDAGVIVDDELYDILVKPLPEGAGLTALFDSCHSGSVLDLPWTYETGGTIKAPEDLQEDAEAEALGTEDHQKRYKWSPADVVSLSGCRDNQFSSDAQFGGLPSGALSYAFIRAFHKFPELTYNQLLKAIFNELKGKFDQRPQVS